MAHRANVIQVAQTLESADPSQKVKDPVCHTEILRKFSRHVLVRGERTLYFCSKECMDSYVSHQYLPTGT